MKHHRPHRRASVLVAAWTSAALAFSAAWSFAAEASTSPAGQQALDAAFRFATVLDVDPKDKARAQQNVVQDYVTIDEIDVGLQRAEQIEGWRKGMVYAFAAVELARSASPRRASSSRT